MEMKKDLLFGNFLAKNCVEIKRAPTSLEPPWSAAACICYFNVDVPINILNTPVYDILNLKQHTQYPKMSNVVL